MKHDWSVMTPDEIQAVLKHADAATLKDWYESEAGRMSGEALCSEPSITEVLLKMTKDYDAHYQTVLDVGCGFNLEYDFELEARGKKVSGVDLSQGFVDKAAVKIRERKSSITVRQADASKLPFLNGSFDAVILSESLEHMPDEKSVLREIQRVLAPRGILFFTVPNYWNYHRIFKTITRLDLGMLKMMPGHLREYSKGKVCKVLRPYFQIDRFYPVEMGYDKQSRGRFADRIIRSDWMGLSAIGKSTACVAFKKTMS